MKNQQYKDPLEESPLEDDQGDDDNALDELDFSDEPPPPPTFGDVENDPDTESDDVFAQAREAGLTEAALPGHGPTDDDLTPETLIHEDGANSPHELGGDEANDQHLTIIDEGDMEGNDEIDDEDTDGFSQFNTVNNDEINDVDLPLDSEDETDTELENDMDESEEDDLDENEDEYFPKDVDEDKAPNRSQ